MKEFVKCSFVLYLTLFIFSNSYFAFSEASVETDQQQKLYNSLAPRYRFKVLDEPGLDMIEGVMSIVQDSQGFMWFGGVTGLARYDGYDIKIYYHDVEDHTSISGAYISSLLIDSDGELWATSGEGLNQYNKYSDDFIRFDQNPSEPDIEWLNSTWHVTQGRDKSLIVSTDGGFSRLDIKEAKFRNYRPDKNLEFGMRERANTVAFEDSDGAIWIGGRSGGVQKYNPETGRYKQYLPSDSSSNSLTPGEVRDIYRDRFGVLWVGTYGGLNRYDHRVDGFINYLNDPEDAYSISGNIIECIVEDSSGNLIIGTDGAGLNIFNRTDDKFIRYGTREGLLNNKIKTIYEDDAGGLWVGHFPAGISVLDRYASAFHNYRHEKNNENSLSSSDVLSAELDEVGNIWVGTDGGGLNFINRDEGIIERFKNDPVDPGSISSNAVLSIEYDNGGLWVGTWQGGLNYLDIKSKRFKRVGASTQNGLVGSEVWSVYADKNAYLWVGTEKGLNRYDKKRQEFKYYTYIAGDPEGVHEGPVTRIYEDSEGNIWLTGYMGITKFDRATEKFKNYMANPLSKQGLSDRTVRDLYEDSAGELWVATSDGLNVFDRKEEVFRTYKTKDGLPSNGIAGILEDNNGYLWFSTARGISRFDRVSSVFRNFTVENGLPGNLSKRPARLKTKTGELIFGTTTGLTIFSPEKVATNTYVPKVVITDFKLFNKSINPKVPGSPLDKPVSLSSRITLMEKQSVFSFEFSALNYVTPEKNQYSYKLEGFDDRWNNVGNQRTATYTNLNPGKYNFRVRGSNNEGLWNKEGTSIEVIILPPWWKTWWAYALYVLSIVFVFVWAVYTIWQRKRSEDERRVNQKLLQVDKMKDAFLANTSHELRTPLNGIIGLSESLIDGAAGDLADSAKENLRMIVSSGKRLSCLINDILDFSKLREHTIQLNRQRVDLCSLADVVLTLSRPLVGRKNIELINDIGRDTPSILADENRLQQVLYNLVGNAIKFTQSGHVKVSSILEGDELWIAVEDTGIGIPEDKLEKVFLAFEQVEDEDENYGGTGLGLAVTKQLVELHGGTLKVESTVGKGSIFKFSLTISTQVIADIGSPVETITQNIGETSEIRKVPTYIEVNKVEESERRLNVGSGKYHILVVDDEMINRQVLLNILSMQELRVTECEDGQQALDVLSEENDIDLVLLDVMMPRLSGYDVCRKLRETFAPHQLPIIFLTAKNQVSDMETGYQVGGNDYLTKPIAKEELLARVNTHLELLEINRNLEVLVNDRTAELRESHDELAVSKSELEMSHEKLKRSQSQLVQSEKMSSLGILIAGVGHELNNPAHLTNLASFTLKRELDGFGEYLFNKLSSSVEESDLVDVAEKYEKIYSPVSSILSGVERIDEIVDNLRSFSRSDVKEFKLDQVAKGLQSTISLVKVNFKHDVDFNVEIKDDPEIECLVSELNQVFMNLMVNACQAIMSSKKDDQLGPVGSLFVKMYIEGENLIVSVRDTGGGIPPEVLHHIFDPFYTTKPEGEGTGLGLSISYDIIDRHRGRIEVNSIEGDGTEFKVFLPVYDPSGKKTVPE